jgi:hypothetical protein
MNLEDIILSEINQEQKNKYYMILLKKFILEDYTIDGSYQGP